MSGFPPALLIYPVHALFWLAFGLTRVLALRSARSVPAERHEVAAGASQTGPHSRVLVLVHMLAFGTMYFGIGTAIRANRVHSLFFGQRAIAILIIAAGAGLACWALRYFGSWRVRAKLDEGHRLATGGPFRFVRHPIYLGLNLLALGTAIWIPTAILWGALLLMVIGSDLRARAEEKLLTRVFGVAYSAYCERTRRFLPGIY